MNNGYIAYIVVKTQEGESAVFTAAQKSCGLAIREVCAKLNTAMAGSGGYPDPETAEVLTAVFPVPEGIQEVRHEVKEDMLRVFPVKDDQDETTPLTACLIMRLNPLQAERVLVL